MPTECYGRTVFAVVISVLNQSKTQRDSFHSKVWLVSVRSNVQLRVYLRHQSYFTHMSHYQIQGTLSVINLKA